VHSGQGPPAHTPHTDAEIAVKLRMAGFGKNQIAKTLTSENPFVQHMDAEQRTIYLGNCPRGEPSQAWRQVQQFQQMRVTRR